MHRNTARLLVLLGVVAALLIGINIGRGLPSSEIAVSAPTPGISPTPTIGYLAGSTCGVSFLYPNTFTAVESSGSGMVLANTTTPEASIVIVCQEEIPRVPLPPEKIETLILTNVQNTSSVSAKLYHDGSQKDGSPIDKLIFTHPKTTLDVIVAGFGTSFDQLLQSLKLQ